MKTTQQLNVTLPQDIAELVERTVRSGAYASASDVIREGVRVLIERDAKIDQWLRDEVVAGHDEYLADPEKAVPANQMLERIKSGRAKVG